MTQASLAERFQASIANINMHIRNIYKARELSEESTIKLDLKVQKEGSRTVNRALKNTHSSKERKWFGAACFPRVFAHNFGGLIARSWSTEAQGNIPAFYYGYIDAFGTGFDRTFTVRANNGVEYKYNNDEFEFTFFFKRKQNVLNDKIKDKINKNLTKEEQ